MKELAGLLEKHLQEICLVPSRHVGSPGLAAAADYIENSLKGMGYTVDREPFETTGWRFGFMQLWDLDNACCEVPGALPCFFSQSCNVTGVPVWLNDEALKHLTSEMVKDKLCIVEFFSEAADIRGRNGVAEELDRLGAAGAIFISDASYHTTCAASTKIQRSPDLKTLGTAVVSESGAYYLARNRHHRYKLLIDADTFPNTSYNVVAVRQGTGSKRAVIGAHYDAAPLGHAACDNASGVACVLELARIFKDKLPEWTLEFAFFDAEEYCKEGIMPTGSNSFVQAHKDRKWEFFMNFDSVGMAWSEDALHVGRKEDLPEFVSCYQILPMKNAGDDRSFDCAGVPTLWFNSHEKYRDFHTPLDSIATMDFNSMARFVEDGASVLEQLCR